ncbi:hypothetical protein RsTz2092_10710 [Deferribacterales bacterium RsTz2092]|nr:hypothetical protein AGMMS49941_09020 [Deferribacterales bacterium]
MKSKSSTILIALVVTLLCYVGHSHWGYSQSRLQIDVITESGNATMVRAYRPTRVPVVVSKHSENDAFISLNTYRSWRSPIPNILAEVAGSGQLAFVLNAPLVAHKGGGHVKGLSMDYASFAIDDRQFISGSQRAEADAPLKYVVNVKDGDKLKLDIKYRRHVSAVYYWHFLVQNIHKYIAVFILATLVVYFFGKYVPVARAAIGAVVSRSIGGFDLQSAIQKLWQNTPSLYIKSFLLLFIAINVAFSYHTIYNTFGHHDWNAILGQPITHGHDIELGRWALYLVPQFFLDNRILPIITNMLAFAGLAIAPVALAVYWKLHKTLFAYSIFGLPLVLSPFIMSWLWFRFSEVGACWAPLLATLGLILFDKADTKRSTSAKTSYFIVAILITTLALGTHQSTIDIMAIMVFGRIAIDLLLGIDDGVIDYIYNKRLSVVGIVVSVAMFLIVSKAIVVLTHIANARTIMATPSQMLSTLFYVFSHIVNLWHYEGVFLPSITARLVCVMLICVVVRVFFAYGWRRSLLVLLSIISAIVFSRFTAIAGPGIETFMTNTITITQSRVDFFGIRYLFVLPIALIFVQNSLALRNIAIVLTAIILKVFIIQDFWSQNVWKQGFESEQMLWNRMLTRIESSANYEQGKGYTVVLLGNMPSHRYYYYGVDNQYPRPAIIAEDDVMAKDSYSPNGIHSLAFYSANYFINDTCFYGDYGNGEVRSQNKPACVDALLTLAPEIEHIKPYPAPNSVVVKGDLMLIATESYAVDYVKDIIKTAKKR